MKWMQSKDKEMQGNVYLKLHLHFIKVKVTLEQTVNLIQWLFQRMDQLQIVQRNLEKIHPKIKEERIYRKMIRKLSLIL